MSTTAIERHVLRTAALAPALLLTGSMGLLFARLRPDV
ncbi:MAG: hypothetical protein QOD85_2568, partial [Gaiellaceae bacterium]|nr:hypothetical protein [Gaiellaceae bacterium]